VRLRLRLCEKNNAKVVSGRLEIQIRNWKLLAFRQANSLFRISYPQMRIPTSALLFSKCPHFIKTILMLSTYFPAAIRQM